jgi:hypothetical protein
MNRADVEALVRPEEFVGLSPLQVDQFLASHVDPILARERDLVSAEVGEVRI